MSKRDLIIAFSGRFPSEKAAALFVAENARSLSLKCTVTIVVPKRRGILGNAHKAYHLPDSVRVQYLPTVDVFGTPFLSRLAFYIHQAAFSYHLYHYLKSLKGTVVIANDLLPGLAAERAGCQLVYEVHDYPERLRRIYSRLFRHALLVVATNQWKREQLAREFTETSGKLMMERNGVDLKAFGRPQEKETCRARLDLPLDAKIVVYTGHLYSWKGVPTLLEAARNLPDVLCICVGGTVKDVEAYKHRYAEVKNVRFIGYVEHAQIPLWQGAADALCLPNTAKEEISVRYTSPMKLFEYMASGRPIVASALPSIEEVLPMSAAFYFAPDDPAALGEAIRTVFADPQESLRRAQIARSAAQSYDWSARTERLLTRICEVSEQGRQEQGMVMTRT